MLTVVSEILRRKPLIDFVRAGSVAEKVPSVWSRGQ